MKQNGFTLIELMIVIAIISIIVSVGLPVIMGHRQNTDTQPTVQDTTSPVPATPVQGTP